MLAGDGQCEGQSGQAGCYGRHHSLPRRFLPEEVSQTRLHWLQRRVALDRRVAHAQFPPQNLPPRL